MRHFLCQILGQSTRLSFSVALHASRMQAAPTACALIRRPRATLPEAPLLGPTRLLTEALPPITFSAKPNLLLATSTLKQAICVPHRHQKNDAAFWTRRSLWRDIAGLCGCCFGAPLEGSEL